MPRIPKVTESEWLVMEAVWASQPTTAADLTAALHAENDWGEATVKTFINRLVNKGALTYQRDGKRYVYRAKVARTVLLREHSRGFIERFFSGSTQALVAHFVDAQALSAEEVERLRALLDRKTP